MKRCFFSFILISGLIWMPTAKAQYYQNGLGLRLGKTSAISYKRFLTREQALEFWASGRDDGFQLTTLYEWHKPTNLNISDNFYFYYGVGAHLGYVKDQSVQRVLFPDTGVILESSNESLFTMGVNTIIGLEFRWVAVPMTIGLDIKPFFEFIGMRETEFTFWDVGVNFKYIF